MCQEEIIRISINKWLLYHMDRQVFIAMTENFLRVDFTGLLCQFGTCGIHTVDKSVS